ncbi:hypothetical protein [Alteromonas gracilis]|uniref:hypothetical protein n=1 Tax=Alteromonas gracilis TaxID=1479524 RepID=UPI0030CB59FB
MKKALVIFVVAVFAVLAWIVYLSSEADKRDQEAAKVPLITVMEILHASDLQQGIKQAVENKNEGAVDEWMKQAIAVSEAANLSKQDLDYLMSETAKDYVVFNAKRQLFNEAFEARYYSLEEVESLKQQYPEAKDLFARTDVLIRKRDAIIEQIAKTLSGSNTVDDVSLNKARQQWREQAEKLEQ